MKNGKEQIQELFRQWDASGLDPLISSMTDDVEVRIGAAPAVQGKENARHALSEFFSGFGSVEHSLEIVKLASKDRYFIWGELRSKRPDSEDPVRVPVSLIFSYRPGSQEIASLHYLGDWHFLRTTQPSQPAHPVQSARPMALALGRFAVGASASGALAIGAFSIGALAIARLFVRNLSIKRLRIDLAEVRELRIEQQGGLNLKKAG